jgi:archaellum biogenesis ATPase FlaH
MITEALQYHKAGLKVIPVFKKEDGSIRFPAWKKWSEGAEQSENDVKNLFAVDCWGLAILCTDGLEVIDIDVKQDPTKTIANDYFNEVVFSTGDSDLLPLCTSIKTKSNGYHLIYRTDKPEGNQKLTVKHGSPEAVIETRGVGGLIFAYPTPGYKVLRGSYEAINKISDEQRDGLITAAKVLSAFEPVQQTREVEREYKPTSAVDLTPWDDFNEKHDVRDIIERHGWKELPRSENSKYHYYSKPDSKSGDIHGVVVKGENIFFTFTTATVFAEQKGYTPYAVLAMLEYSGDFSRCAKELSSQGFGTKPEAVRKEQAKEVILKGDAFANLEATRFDYNANVKEEEATLTMTYNNRTHKIGGQGMIGGILGPKKSGKSLLTAMVVAARLSGKRKLVFDYVSQGKKVLYFDTEQSAFFYHLTQKFIFNMAGFRDNSPVYEAYHLRRATVEERVAFIDMVIERNAGNIELIIVDGLVDLCKNFNDENASRDTVQTLMDWSDKSKAMILTVLHTTKVGGYAQGHLGSTLEKKYDFGWTVSKDDDTHTFRVKHRDSRFAPFPSFEFERDQDGFPFMDGEQSEPEEVGPPEIYDAKVMPAYDDNEPIPF